MQAQIAAHGLGRDVNLPGELPAPATGADHEARRRPVPGRAGLNGVDYALTQIDGQG